MSAPEQTNDTTVIRNTSRDDKLREPKDKKTKRKSSRKENKSQAQLNSETSATDKVKQSCEGNNDIFVISGTHKSISPIIAYHDGAYLNVPIEIEKQ